MGGTKAAFQDSATTYDAAGRALTFKDHTQLSDSSRGYTSYTYDALGRQTEVLEASGTAAELETDLTWDALDRQLTDVHGAGTATAQTTTYRYDVGGRVTEQDDEFTC